MLARWSDALKGALTMALLVLNVIAWCLPLFAVALAKLLVPWRPWRDRVNAWLNGIGDRWIRCNGVLLWSSGRVRLDVRGAEGLRRRDWYLMIANHRSWVDILVLQAVFNRRAPFLKFFLKERLRWVPFLGLAWWALDMPFMKRYSSAFLARHPEMRGRDLEATRKACEKFRRIPTTIINFVEGTRLTLAKHGASGGGFRNLLPAKAGGMAYALTAMSGMLRSTIDVTIAYGDRTPSLWDLCCGRLRRLIVQVREREIEPWMQSGNYADDPAFRERFQAALAGYWREKDELLDRLLLELRAPLPA